nr:unnamed protein product [Digitaria exilis]
MAAQTHPMVLPTDTELLKAQADLWRHSLCYLTSIALKCAVELGIPTAIYRLGGAATLSSLATELSIPQSKFPFLGRIMRFLTSSGIFTTDDSSGEGTYNLNLLSKLLVDGIVLDGDAHQKAIVLTTTSRYYMEAALGLASWLKKDTSPPVTSPFQDLHGATLFDDSMACLDPEAHELFSEALAAHDNLGISVVLQKCPELFKGIQSLTDCCGGDGTTARAIIKAFPDLKCTVLDLHPVINKISADDTIEYVAGDMFKIIPPAQAVMLKV